MSTIYLHSSLEPRIFKHGVKINDFVNEAVTQTLIRLEGSEFNFEDLKSDCEKEPSKERKLSYLRALKINLMIFDAELEMDINRAKASLASLDSLMAEISKENKGCK